MTASKGKVLMAMSGGVDSSTAAVRLLEEGYELLKMFGLPFKNAKNN